MHELVVGVDAGGSHTVAALASQERVLRAIAGEAANPNVVGVEAAALAIAEVIERVLDGETPAAICAGVAGAGSEAIQDRLREMLGHAFPRARVAVTHDARIALRAVIPEGDGVVLIAGTGSIAYAEANGRALRAGGYGYLLGDEGSGYAIGAAALRRLLVAAESIAPEGPMLRQLADHVGARARPEILARIYQSAEPVATIAACAPIVLRHASAGDADALAIVERAADALSALIVAVAQGFNNGAIAVGFSGGLLRENSPLTDGLAQRLAVAPLDLRVVPERREPYYGALTEALRLLAPS
jgi:N-acetylglucosamine kinase-like BadF-type ATPase